MTAPFLFHSVKGLTSSGAFQRSLPLVTPPTQHPPPTPCRGNPYWAVPPLSGEMNGADFHSSSISQYRAVRHVRTSMVWYVILHRFLQEIPPWISFRDIHVSAWTTPRRGHLRGVATPDPATWGFELPTEYSTADVPTVTEFTDEDYRCSSDEETKDWPYANENSREKST